MNKGWQSFVLGTLCRRSRWKSEDVFYVSINMILSWVVVAAFPRELSFMTFLKVGFVQRAEQGKMILEKWNLF